MGKHHKRRREETDEAPKSKNLSKAAKLAAEELIEPEYVIDQESGLRKVVPYWFTHRTMAKGRWWKRSLLDVFTKEFQDQSPDYYRRAILAGKISVNNQKKPLDYILKNGDLVCHATHRHEPPVGSHEIKIVFEDEEILVIDKPPSIPVHPSGRYTFNTVLEILQSKEYGYRNLFSVNRIDRLTSGILLVALTKEKASQLASELAERNVSKVYLCRVRGKFPEDKVACLEPIHVVSNKLGVNIVSPEGRPCETHFTLLSYNPKSDTSVVQCEPKTGRTHQIRVHLQWLGFPISNDPLYCNKDLFGENLGKGGVLDQKDVLERIKTAKELGDLGEGPSDPPRTEGGKKDDGVIPSSIPGDTLSLDDFPCPECAIKRKEPSVKDLKIYLHSWKYSGEGWAYETEMPVWAAPDHLE
ncbi:UNVERIFIED_CONTAM: hypothetical protein HDU68_010469 [Siphonaria sp. JEL0065]|nr:hypothetical protein HDU68_010469 [Siphonaria sp. JEL0065]